MCQASNLPYTLIDSFIQDRELTDLVCFSFHKPSSPSYVSLFINVLMEE